MARIVLVSPDLLFGSKVEGGLVAAGHEVRRFSAPDEGRAAAAGADVLVVDLGASHYETATLVEWTRPHGELVRARTLGYYPHVDQDIRRRAERAGFDLVVPRSRMARDMAALVERLLAAPERSAARFS